MKVGKALFPAHAGVFPSAASNSVAKVSLPRTRGGISYSSCLSTRSFSSSPHTRGYFQVIGTIMIKAALFPAHAGVFPLIRGKLWSILSLPRTRGGISMKLWDTNDHDYSSPHTRGYFRVFRAQ
ncbi:Domain of uncharacterised function (DUF2825) [Arcanobacterium haemolyticum]|nr:Domain of uncharacterised function (DUF2825) [Arcanobacterium haemolyticum]